jgi:hypothetical protein
VTGELHPAVVDLLRYFEYGHLPPHLQAISRPFHNLAHDMAERLTGPQVRDGLFDLLRSKDCMVRAALPGAEAEPGPERRDLGADVFAAPAPPPNGIADRALAWLREQPDGADHAIDTEPLSIEQDANGNIRLIDVPDAFAIDVALLRHSGLRGISFEDGILSVDTSDTGWTRYRTLYATDHGFSIVCRRED